MRGVIVKNVANRSARQSFDSYHTGEARFYCGARVGQIGYHAACGMGDGRCGPDSGCQCHACHELDEEIARRRAIMGLEVFRNRNNRECHISYNPAAQNGHYSAGYKFYCGGTGVTHRPGGRQCTCDGTCGPNNGCQCSACFELEEAYHRREIPAPERVSVEEGRNNANRKVRCSFDSYHRRRYLRYCGANVGQSGYHQPCGRCDGRCGPNSGCQCQACHALDEVIAQRQQQLGLEVIDIFRNQSGHECHVSFCPPSSHGTSGYKFYCGRRVGREGYQPQVASCRCDGVCGPSNGCQCSDCFALDRRAEVYAITRELIAASPSSRMTPLLPRPATLPTQPVAAPPTAATPNSGANGSEQPAIGDDTWKVNVLSVLRRLATVEDCIAWRRTLDQWQAVVVQRQVHTTSHPFVFPL
jgi:hypothetical protein